MAAVAVPRYMNTVDISEAAAEQAVIDALREAVEKYSTEQFMGRYDYPTNPFELVCRWFILLAVNDGSMAWWKVYSQVHQRRDNTRIRWTYSTADDS